MTRPTTEQMIQKIAKWACPSTVDGCEYDLLEINDGDSCLSCWRKADEDEVVEKWKWMR